MNNKTRLRLVLLAASALLFTAACGGGGASDNKSSNGDGGAVVTDIPEVYSNSTCITCHGADLKGRGGSRTNLQKVGARLTHEEIVDVITNGRPSKGMPAQAGRISEEEINELADWLSTLK